MRPLLRSSSSVLACALCASWLAVANAQEQVAPGTATPTGASAGPDSSARSTDPSAQLEQARKLFEEGLVHVEAGDWSAAEQAFRRVLAVRSSPVVAYNLASALARLGRLNESAELLRTIVRDSAVDDSTRTPAEQLLRELEPQIGSLTVRVLGDPEGLLLRLDDTRVLSTSELVQAISVDPGVHVLVAERGGVQLASETVSVGGAAPLKAEVTLDLRAHGGTESPSEVSPVDLRVSQLPGERVHSRQRDERGGSVWESPWLWGGAGAAVVIAAGVIVALLVSGEAGQLQPVAGDTDPSEIRGRVVPEGM